MEMSFLEDNYGVGTKLKINNLFYSTTTKSIVVDCKIIFGDEINETLLDVSAVELIISNAISLFYPDSKLSITVSWDC